MTSHNCSSIWCRTGSSATPILYTMHEHNKTYISTIVGSSIWGPRPRFESSATLIVLSDMLTLSYIGLFNSCIQYNFVRRCLVPKHIHIMWWRIGNDNFSWNSFFVIFQITTPHELFTNSDSTYTPESHVDQYGMYVPSISHYKQHAIVLAVAACPWDTELSASRCSPDRTV